MLRKKKNADKKLAITVFSFPPDKVGVFGWMLLALLIAAAAAAVCCCCWWVC
jgi:hypothetical protein